MRNGEKGQVLVLFVAGLTGLIGVAALGVDVGYMYTIRHELQRSTDAGALAGASAFLDGDWNNSAIRDLARARANQYTSMDKVASATLDPSLEVDVKFPGKDRVRVEATRTVPLFFSRMFLGATKTIRAYSIAEATPVGRNVRGLKPWGIPFPWDDANGNGLYDPGETIHRDCPEGIEGTPMASQHFCPGTRVILKIGVPHNSPKNPEGDLPSLQQEPGHFFALDYDAAGGAGYRDAIQHDSAFTASVKDTLTLETGNMVGPTVQGVDDLLNLDTGSHWDDNLNRPVSSDYGFEGDAWMASPRVVRIPIYDPEDALKTGKSGMTVAGFAGFWIERIERQGTIIGRFVPNRAFGNIAPSDGLTIGPSLKVLRLVE